MPRVFPPLADSPEMHTAGREMVRQFCITHGDCMEFGDDQIV